MVGAVGPAAILAAALLLAPVTPALAGGPTDCEDLSIVPVRESVDLDRDIQPILDAVCTGCHIGASPPGNLRLDSGASYALTVNIVSNRDDTLLRVAPGKPTESLLFNKINCNGPDYGSRMPPGPTLGLPEQALMYDWIAAGAPLPGEVILRSGLESQR